MGKSIQLTREQKEEILNHWNERSEEGRPPTIIGITELIYGEGFDGRSQEGRAIKEFLASRSLKAQSNHDYAPKLITLKESQKEYIENNASTMTVMEIASALFDKDDLRSGSQEVKSISQYISTISDELRTPSILENIKNSDYKPPKSIVGCIERANRYIAVKFDRKSMGPKAKKDVKALIGFLHTYKFLYQMEVYCTTKEKDLFESTFVRYTHDKFDLTAEEVDQYIIVASEVVNCWNVQKQISALRTKQQESLLTDEKLSMAFVEAIGKANTELNQSTERQNKMFKNLTQDRKKRLEKRLDENSSLLNFVELFKQEETRKQMLELAQKRNLENKEEINRLSSIEDLKCRIIGATENRSLYG